MATQPHGPHPLSQAIALVSSAKTKSERVSTLRELVALKDTPNVTWLSHRERRLLEIIETLLPAPRGRKTTNRARDATIAAMAKAIRAAVDAHGVETQSARHINELVAKNRKLSAQERERQTLEVTGTDAAIYRAIAKATGISAKRVEAIVVAARKVPR